MKNTEKISPSEKIIEKLKEEKILEKIDYSDFVKICLEFVEYFIFPFSNRELSSYVSYSRDFLRGKIDKNKIYKYQNEAFKDYLNLSEQLEKSIQDVVCLCLNYKFLTSYYSEWTVEPKNPIWFKSITHYTLDSAPAFLHYIEDIDGKLCEDFYEYLKVYIKNK